MGIPQFESTVTAAFRTLLSEKHLYQSVTADSSEIDALARQSATKKGHVPIEKVVDAEVQNYRRAFLDEPLWLINEAVSSNSAQSFPAPTIKTVCPVCGERGPFNCINAEEERSRSLPSTQWFFLTYQCQNCKKEPAVRFMVKRHGRKITLTGRDPFEAVEISSVIPKDHATNLRNAVIASHAGQLLAGLFLMRVFVEQYWKSIPAVQEAIAGKPRVTGDEMGTAYKGTLDDAFKSRFPTLAEVYDSLSEAMHNARADEAVFADCYAKIIRHFDALRLWSTLS